MILTFLVLIKTWLEVHLGKSHTQHLQPSHSGPLSQEQLRLTSLQIRYLQRWMRLLHPNPSCWIQALTLQRVLNLRGIPSQIQLAARRNPHTLENEFHALLFVDGRARYGDLDQWDQALKLEHAP